MEMAAALAGLLGEAPAAIEPVGGGDIGDSYRARTRAGEPLFVKLYAGPDAAAMVDAEARGLAWLAEPGALRLPRVHAAGPAGGSGDRALLVLEWIEPGRAGRVTHEALGRGLANLHAAGADGFGAADDNFIGRLPQSNAPAPSWPEFYRDRRLQPLLERGRAAGLVDARLSRQADALLAKLPQLVGPAEPPARLHGDLWGGNWLCDSEGAPVLIDPATYGGHREVDLAMMRLFGGFPERAFDAYEEEAPLAPGHEQRVPLYQLYPLLVHLALFGSGYAASVERAIGAYV